MTRAIKPEAAAREGYEAGRITAAPTDPALRVLLGEMEALARILPPHDVPGAEADDDQVEAVFDNMPV